MKIEIYIIASLFLLSCTSKTNEAQVEEDTTAKSENIDTSRYEDPYDSLANVKVDTSTLEGKRTFILNRFMIENELSEPTYDSLFDLNYDGNADYVIGYYGMSGSGLKNRAEVYFCSKRNNSYQLNEQLSRIPNPSFYIEEKKITGFYLPNGAGSGVQLEWIDGKWLKTKEFTVDNEEEKSVWHLFYPLTEKRDSLVLPYEMTPPKEILDTKVE